MIINTTKNITFKDYEEIGEILIENGHDLMVMPEKRESATVKQVADEKNILINAKDESILCINEGIYCISVYCSPQTLAAVNGEMVINELITIKNIRTYGKDYGEGLFGGIREFYSFDIYINDILFKEGIEISKNVDIQKSTINIIVDEIVRIKHPNIDKHDEVHVWETEHEIKNDLINQITSFL